MAEGKDSGEIGSPQERFRKILHSEQVPPAPFEEPTIPSQEPAGTSTGLKSEKDNGLSDAAKIAAGVVGGEVLEGVAKAVVNEGARRVRRMFYGGRGERKRVFGQKGGGGENVPPGEPPSEPPAGRERNEGDPIHNASFAKVMSMSTDDSLPQTERELWIKEKELRIDEFQKFDKGDFVADTRRHFQSVMRNSEWDAESGKGVYDQLNSYSENRDTEYNGRHESEPRLRGLIGVAIRAEAARVLVAGIENKFTGMSDDARAAWLRAKNYTGEEVSRLRRLASENHIFDFATDAPEELVGAALGREAEAGTEAFEERVERIRSERRESLQEIPLYFGAVFKDGKNEVHVTRPELIPILNLRDPNDRVVFIFKNLFAFNYLFGNGSMWRGAEDDWMKDAKVARLANGISFEEFDNFGLEKDLAAMMAVTASARAMESSEGVFRNYAASLVGADEKGEPKLGAQETMGSLLLHADPEKMITALKNPLVKMYYDRLMRDAGLSSDPYYEWRQFRDPDKPGETVQIASSLVWLNGSKDGPRRVRETSLLVDYLGDSARKGGFQTYIQEVLLAADNPEFRRRMGAIGFNDEVRMAAAKLATDLFLVDKFTRWSYELTDHGKNTKLKLQPTGDWGGDPLGSIINPTGLPRLKKVYTGEGDVKILDFLEGTIKPEKLFARLQKDYRGYEGVEGVHLVIPSIVTNMKTLSRLSDATYKVFGGSMATGLASWAPKMMQEEIPQMADLLTQVYGGLTVNREGSKKKLPLGKHLVGAMVMRILYAKSLAATAESARPGFKEHMKLIFDPQSKTRPFLDVMQFLYGADLDARSGFLQSLTGPRYRLILRDNMFDAAKIWKDTYHLLQTNDQRGGFGGKLANDVGLGLDILRAIGEGFGVIKGGR